MSDSVDRRDFLTTGAAAAGALAFAANLYAQDSQTINVGIIGCGGRGSGAVRNILDADKNVRITALCDLHENKAKGTLAGAKRRAPNQVTDHSTPTGVGVVPQSHAESNSVPPSRRSGPVPAMSWSSPAPP